MSRSFYKSPYASWVCYKSDKWCRQQYHRERRRKDKSICGRLVGDIYEDDVLDGCYRSEEDFVNANIDRSLRFADKYCWDSDGGKYYRGGLEDCRKDFDEEVFTSREKYGVKHTPVWENYKSYVKKVFNKEKPEYTVKLKRKVVKKIDFGFYMPWGFFDEPSYEIEKKYIKTTIYPPRFKPEDGWETFGGDGFGCFSPIGKLTVQEVIAIGDYLSLPKELVHKTPSDGMCGSTDEEKLGFTYECLDNYIRTGVRPKSIEIYQRIMNLNKSSHFKHEIIHLPTYDPGLYICEDFNW